MHKIITLPFGLYQACCYLILLPSATCLIDPAVPPSRLPAGLPPIQWIMATHGHLDHISQADQLRQHTHSPLWIHPNDAQCLTDANQNLSALFQKPLIHRAAEKRLSDSLVIPLSDGYAITVLHTPGHTSGSVCFLLSKEGEAAALFSGDTLFAGSIGRLDLGGDPSEMEQSLRRLLDLGHRLGKIDLPVYPGHGNKTALLQEILTNPYFQALQNGSLQSWLR